MRRGVLDEPAAARLLIAAGLVDLIVVYIATSVATPRIQAAIPALRVDYAAVAIFLLLMLLMWVLSDLLLAGYSPGRLAVGLEMAHRSGRHLSLSRRALRLVGKITTLGMTGLRLDRLAGYDRAAGTIWLSAMSQVSPLPVEEWRLRFLSGEHAGKAVALARLPGFAARKSVRIGRDKGWATLTLNDSKVSGRHCELRVRDGQLELRDGADGASASANGTSIDGRKVAHDRWTRVDSGRTVQVGGVRIVIGG